VAAETLSELSLDREVRSAAAFRQVAEKLDAATLARLYRRQMETAPRRAEAGKQFFGERDGQLPKRGARADVDQLAIALANHRRHGGRAMTVPGRLPSEPLGSLLVLDDHVPLDAGRGVVVEGAERVDLVGVGAGDRLAVVVLRWLPPSAARGATGDTPLRALIEGLARCAILDASRDAVCAEAESAFGCKVTPQPPLLYFVASPRYWELCRRRESQKGAAWIRELERLARVVETGDEAESGEALGVGVRFLALALDSDPAWEIRDGAPTLVSEPRLTNAWEWTAGRVRPKPRPKAKTASSEPKIVEADLSRPPRPYQVTGRYAPGDRIEHPTLGLGVVQGSLGPAKIEVLFDGVKRVLVHERPGAPASPA
jgi:hypothetical protein